MRKISRWIKSLCRILIFKIEYGKNFKVSLNLMNPVFIGDKVKIHISANGKIILEKGVYLDDYTVIDACGGTIVVSNGTYINTRSNIVSMKQIYIGSDCMFGSNVSIYDHDHDFSKGVREGKKQYVTEIVKIEKNVWLGTGCVVVKGITIGNNSVVGANGVVTKSLEANGVYAGNPVKKIRSIAI